MREAAVANTAPARGGWRRPTSPTRYTSEWGLVGDGGQDGCIQRKVGVGWGRTERRKTRR
jgi:hypothetical protein